MLARVGGGGGAAVEGVGGGAVVVAIGGEAVVEPVVAYGHAESSRAAGTKVLSEGGAVEHRNPVASRAKSEHAHSSPMQPLLQFKPIQFLAH